MRDLTRKHRRQGKSREPLPVCAVLLAGGRGTRFWPRSRMRTPKQLLKITGHGTMLHETVARLAPLVPTRNIWAVTNVKQAEAVRAELRGVPASHILAEPVGRNTAAAIGLVAIHLTLEYGDALMAILPSDSYVANAPMYRRIVRAALALARMPHHLAVLGIPPSRPETGYGYIERGKVCGKPRGIDAFRVLRFTEKPGLPLARKYMAAGTYLWNAGMFFCRASTLLDALERFLPATHALLTGLGKTIGTRRYATALQRIYPKLENISVDCAILEPATRSQPTVKPGKNGAQGIPQVSVIPAEVGWSDIGSWDAVYALLAAEPGANVLSEKSFTLDAHGNYFWTPNKFVAAIGVTNLVLVETKDALLVCSRERSQEVGKIVKWLEEKQIRGLV